MGCREMDSLKFRRKILHDCVSCLRVIWARRIFTILFPLCFGVIYQVSQLSAGIEVVQRLGFVSALILWLCSFILFFIFLFKSRFSAAVVSLVPLILFLMSSAFMGSFRDDICFILDTVYFKIHEDKFTHTVNNSGTYINDQDIYSVAEQTLARTRDFSKLGKFIVFQDGYIPGWQRLIVYDESDQIEDPNTPQRYIGEICVPRPGRKGGDPVPCATDNNGSLLISGSRNMKIKRIYGHFFSVYVEEQIDSIEVDYD